MNESRREELIAAFRDEEYRESYAEDFLNTSLATQLRVLREQRELTQAELAQEVGTKQTAISRIENVNNPARNLGTLMKIAFKLGCRLKVSFETFGSLVDESLRFSRESLMRPTLDEDPVFTGAVMNVPSGYVATPDLHGAWNFGQTVTLSNSFSTLNTTNAAFTPGFNNMTGSFAGSSFLVGSYRAGTFLVGSYGAGFGQSTKRKRVDSQETDTTQKVAA